MGAKLKRLAAVAVLSVHDRDLGMPPSSPVDGDRYRILAGATAAWSGRSGQTARRVGGAWGFHAPRVGWLCFIEDKAVLLFHKAAGWSAGVAI